MTRTPGPIRRAWYQWKMMRLPWRRRWLAGFDLEGNTFWEFKDSLNAGRTRRIVKYNRWTHNGDVNVPPQWMQWLRHTRYAPPSVAEQQADVHRQQRMKYLASEADARWAAKPSALDAPDKQQPIQPLESRDPSTGVRQTNADQDVRDRAGPPVAAPEGDTPPPSEQAGAPALKTRKPMKKEPKDSPWKKQAGNPGDEWQPQPWTPGPARRRA